MMRYVGNVIRKWWFYSLERDDYVKCMAREFPNNLYTLWFLGVWFAIFCLVHSVIYFIGMGLSLTPIMFFVTHVGSILFSIFVHHKSKQHKAGRRISKVLVYAMLIGMYAAVTTTGIFMHTFINPDHLAIMYMVLLVSTLVLIFVSPFLSLLITLIASFAFSIFSYFYAVSFIWGNNVRLLSAIAPIALFFTWIANRYRILAAFNAIKLEEERDKYQAQSTIDDLTKLKNRRDFEQRFHRYLADYRESDNLVCLAIVDIDFFKKYNDFYGHPRGDECLRAVGQALAAPWANPSVYAARIGGEEFALLWFEEKIDNIAQGTNCIVTQALQRIRDLNMPHEMSPVLPRITVSIGVSIEQCGISSDTQAVYNSADNALYRAKDKGRNNAVIIYQGSEMYVAGEQ